MYKRNKSCQLGRIVVPLRYLLIYFLLSLLEMLDSPAVRVASVPYSDDMTNLLELTTRWRTVVEPFGRSNLAPECGPRFY